MFFFWPYVAKLHQNLLSSTILWNIFRKKWMKKPNYYHFLALHEKVYIAE